MTNRKQQYREKLTDPRWQKKRLEILQRDEWQCRSCGDFTKTLHVHHLRYSNGDPWKTPSLWLVTLCADCHQEETEMLPGALKELGDAAKFWLWSDEIRIVARLLRDAPLDPNLAEATLVGFLNSPDLINAALDRYLHLSRQTHHDLVMSRKIGGSEQGVNDG